MRAAGALRLTSKSGKFLHNEEKHDEAICRECGAIFCLKGDWCFWQEGSFNQGDYGLLPTGICRRHKE